MPKIDLELDKASDLSGAIHQSLGAASVCWENIPTGNFDSTRALQIGEQLLAYINAHYVKAETA